MLEMITFYAALAVIGMPALCIGVLILHDALRQRRFERVRRRIEW